MLGELQGEKFAAVKGVGQPKPLPSTVSAPLMIT